MSSSPIPSDLIHVICQSLAAFEHSGLQLSPNHVSTLLSNLRTVRTLSRAIEDEVGLLSRQLQGQRHASKGEQSLILEVCAGNVVRFPGQALKEKD